MLESIELLNFQRWKRVKIAFDPHITTLVGSNGKGKTAILRALRWNAINRPVGDSIKRWGSKFVAVRVKIDGHEIIRKRSPSLNGYIVDRKKPGYKAINQAVPDAVAAIWNVDETNFQRQFDSPFWLTLTGGDAGKALNTVVDLEIIDSIMGELLSSFNAARTANTNAGIRLSDAKQSLEAVSDTPDMVKEWERVECERQIAEKTAATGAAFGALFSDAVEKEKTANVCRQKTIEMQTVLKLCQTSTKKHLDLKKLNECRERVREASSVFVGVIDTKALDLAFQKAQKSAARRARIDVLLEDAQSHRETRDLAQKALAAAEARLLVESEGICPLCARTLK